MGRRRALDQNVGDGVYPRPKTGIWELRYQVPPDVAHAFLSKQGKPQKLKVVSTGTRDPRQARAIAREERAKLDVQVHLARTERVEDRLERYLRAIYTEGVGSLAVLRAEEDTKARERLFSRKGNGSGGLKEKIRVGRLKPVNEAEWLEQRIAWGRAAAGNDPDMSPAVAAGGIALAFFNDVLGRTPDTNSAEYQRVLARCAEALTDTIYATVQQFDGKAPPPSPFATDAADPDAVESMDGNRATDPRGNLPFSTYYDEVYLPSKTGEVEASTLKNKRASIDLFKELVGDPAVFLVRKADVADFQDKLRKLPDQRMVTGKLARKSVTELYALCAAGRVDLPRKAAGTVDKHVRDIKGVLAAADKAGHIRFNPGAVVGNVRPNAVNKVTKRRDFTRAELTRIWSQPIYAGCAKDTIQGVYQPGQVLIRDDRFWIPMLLFLTGARASEVAGLELDAVTIEAGEHAEASRIVFRNTGFRRLKNEESERVIPIHPWAFRMGFADFYRSRLEASERFLFPSVAADVGANELTDKGFEAGAIFRQFNRTVREKAGLTGRETTLHSFRHTFETSMTGKDIPEEVMSRLTGRAIGGSRQGYTDSLPHDPEAQYNRAKDYRRHVAKIDFGGLDLTHLFTSE